MVEFRPGSKVHLPREQHDSQQLFDLVDLMI